MGHAAAAAARRLRRRARLRRRDARRPGGQHPWLRDEKLFLQRLLDLRHAGARRLPRRAAAREGGGAPVSAAPRARDRLVRGRADRRGRRRSRLRLAAASASTRSSGTTTRTTCRPARSSSRAARACTQAFRLGDARWGVQFHPEVTRARSRAGSPSDPSRRPTPTRSRPRSARADRGLEGARRGRSAAAFLEAAERSRRAARPGLALERQLGVARPLVPRAGVVAGVVAGRAEGERGERRARAGVAVRDDLGALGRPTSSRISLRRQRQPGAAKSVAPRRSARPGCGPAADRTACRRGRVYSSSRRTSRIVSAGSSSRVASSCQVGTASGRGSSAAFDRCSSTAPTSSSPGQPAIPPREHRHARVAGELRHLRRRHRPDAVAAVVEHEPLLSGDAVAPEPQRDLVRELADRLRVGASAAASRARAGSSPGCGRARARSGRGTSPRRDRARRARSASQSASTTGGRSRHSAATTSQLGRDRGPARAAARASRDSAGARARPRAFDGAQDPRHVGDVGKAVLRAGQVRPSLERASSMLELRVEHARGLLPRRTA